MTLDFNRHDYAQATWEAAQRGMDIKFATEILVGDLDERQCLLEMEMRSLGVDQFRYRIERAKAANRESTTPYGIGLMTHAIEPLAQAIREFIAEANTGRPGRRRLAVRYLEQVEPEIAAFIALRVVLDCISKSRVSLTKVAREIGSRLEDEAHFRKFEQEHLKDYENTLKWIDQSQHYGYRARVLTYAANKHGVEHNPWPEADRINLGITLVHMIEARLGLVEMEQQRMGRTTPVFVQPTAKTLDWINRKILYCEALSPMLMPMVVPPREWTSPIEGGYLMNKFPRLTFVKGRQANALPRVEATWEELGWVREAVSAVSRTGWRINQFVLDVAKTTWELGHQVGKLPNREPLPLPHCPLCGAEPGGKLEKHPCFEEHPDLLSDWKREAKRVHDKNHRLLAKRLQAAKILWLAEKFKDEEAIYFPHQLDFRGRMYPIPLFLQPQGNDLAKGLLLFAKGKPINDNVAAGWLMIHGANVWGYDKCSLEERIQWVHENEQDILRVAADPLGFTWWHEADKPWQFLAFCFEYAAFLRHGYGYVSRLPVSVDGACNGLQHFSAMLRDPIGGAAVNLVPCDTPADIYQEVADKVTAKLRAIVSTGGTDADMADRWLRFGVTRKCCKRPVMVVPYSGTQFTCREYVEEYVRDQIAANPEAGGIFSNDEIFMATVFITKLIWETIQETVVSAKEAMAWLRKCARLATKAGKSLFWVTPTGFPVEQAYPQVSIKRLKTKVGDQIVWPQLKKEEEGTLDVNQQVNGVSPNFVHSLDAAALQMSVCYAKDNGVEEFCMVHDSYGCPAADAEILGRCLRQAFFDLYSNNDVLADFKAYNEAHTGVELPEPPEKGSLDLTGVLESDFFFA